MRRSILGTVTVLLVLGVSGCGGSGGTSTPDRPTATAAPSVAATTSAVAAGVRRDDAQQGAAFTTPTGNITCWLESGKASGGSARTVGCVIDAKTWTAPKSPCPGSAHGSTIVVTGRGKAGFQCQNDISSCFQPSLSEPNACHGPSGLWWRRAGDPTVTTAGGQQAAALPYGSSVRIGAMQCASRTSEVSCADLDTGSGFTLSRERYTLTPSA